MIRLKKIKINKIPWSVPLVFIAFFISVSSSQAVTYYSRSSANWNVASTWSTAGYGGAAATGFPGTNDTARIANGNTITINTNITCARLEIGQGASGIVQYSGAGNYTLTIGGSIVVNTGAVLQYASNNTRTHILQVGGSIINNGTIDLYFDNTDFVNLTFNTSANSVVSGSGSWQLNNVTMSKSFSTSSLEIQVQAFETAIATLTTTTGTFIHNNSGTYSINSTASTDYAISQNVVFRILQGTVSFSPNSNRTYIYGSLYVSGGNVTIGSTAGNYGLRYDKVGTNVPHLEISAGTMTVYGGISPASADPFSFRMTGGTLLLNSGSNGTADEVFFINDVAGSVFEMSGGTVIEQTPNTHGHPRCDWAICGDFGTVSTTGGTVKFGNDFTANGKTFSFIPFANAVQPNFEIAGPAAYTITLCPYNPTTSDFRLLSLKINSGKIFDNRSYVGTSGDSKKMTLVSSYDGIHAFYNDGTFISRTGEVIFDGAEAQIIGGSSITTFYDLNISNGYGVTLGGPQKVFNFLTMNNGILYTSYTNILTCLHAASANIGSITSYIDGPMNHTIASTSLASRNFPLGRGSDYRPAVLTVTHNSTDTILYRGEMFNIPASELSYALPSTINKVSHTRYWDFERTPVLNMVSATMTLYYDVDDTVTDRTRVVVVHDDGNGRWVDHGGTGTADITGNITSNAFASFKTKFSFGFPPSPLPVNLVFFNAILTNKRVLCNWETASEINNDFFTVERSEDGIHYQSIGKRKGAGNSTANKWYQFTDDNPLSGDSYYRLKQTDFDGSFDYSEAVHINVEKQSDYVFFPNPSPGKIYIQNTGKSMEGSSVLVRDMNGREVYAALELSSAKNELSVHVDPSVSSTSDYFIVDVYSKNGVHREKVLVEKK